MFFIGYDQCRDAYPLGNCYCFLSKTLIMQGSTVMPTLYSNRIAFASVMIGGMLIYWYWEAMVISYLAVRTIQLPIITLEEIVKKSNLKVHYKLYIVLVINPIMVHIIN